MTSSRWAQRLPKRRPHLPRSAEKRRIRLVFQQPLRQFPPPESGQSGTTVIYARDMSETTSDVTHDRLRLPLDRQLIRHCRTVQKDYLKKVDLASTAPMPGQPDWNGRPLSRPWLRRRARPGSTRDRRAARRKAERHGRGRRASRPARTACPDRPRPPAAPERSPHESPSPCG